MGEVGGQRVSHVLARGGQLSKRNMRVTVCGSLVVGFLAFSW